VVIGALAAVGLLNVVRNAETVANEEAAAVDVWVVKQPIPKGTPIETAIETNLIALEQTPAKYRPATAVLDPAVELAGLVAIVDLPVDTQLFAGSFASPNVVNTGITERLQDRGLVTVTFEVDQAKGAAYLIEPGDFVNVMVERPWDVPFFEADPPIELTERSQAELLEVLEADDTTRPIISDVYPVDSRYVYQKAEVLAIGQSLVPDLGQSADEAVADETLVNRSLVTLAVPPEAVQVILNVDRRNIYLSLVPEDYEPRPLPPLDPTTQVLPGEVEGRLTPYDGYDGVDNPGLVDRLLFSDDENRIGVPPTTGSDDDAAGSSSSSSSRSGSSRTGDTGDGTENGDANGDGEGTDENADEQDSSDAVEGL
jgi:Flp pilus assembly protein CpaB